MFDWFKKYDSLDEIDEDKRGAFVERDGGYVVDKALDPSGLKSTLEKQKKELSALKAFKSKFGSYDEDQLASLADDLDELNDLRAAKEAGELKGGDDGKIEELVQKRVEAQVRKIEREKAVIEKQLNETTEGLNNTRSKVRELTLGAEARRAAAKAGVKEHSIDDALTHVFRNFDVNDDGEIVDKSDAGRSIEDLYAELTPQKPGWTFDPQAGGTGNAGGKAGGKAQVTRDHLEKMTPRERTETMAKVRAGELQYAAD